MNSIEQRAAYERRVRDLCAPGHRGSGTLQERQAAEYLAGELRQLGLEPRIEPFVGSHSLGGSILVHIATAMLGMAVIWRLPLLTLILGSIALISLILEQTTRAAVLGRWLTRAPSQNVSAMISPRDGPPARRVVVCGHYDTQRTGWVWNERFLRFSRRALPLPGALQNGFLPVVLAIIAQIILSVMALVRVPGWIVTPPALAIMTLYAVLCVLLVQWGWGRHVPGAGDNASGAAAVLSLAERWLDAPIAGTELVLLFPGCEETVIIGAAAWADAHRESLHALPTVFLNLDGLGCGPPRIFGNWEAPIAGWPVHYPPHLIALCQKLAAEAGINDPGPFSMVGPTDGLAFLLRGIPGVTLYGSPDGRRLPNYHLMTDTPERMDFDGAWQGVGFAWRVLQRLAESDRRAG